MNSLDTYSETLVIRTEFVPYYSLAYLLSSRCSPAVEVDVPMTPGAGGCAGRTSIRVFRSRKEDLDLCESDHYLTPDHLLHRCSDWCLSWHAGPEVGSGGRVSDYLELAAMATIDPPAVSRIRPSGMMACPR